MNKYVASLVGIFAASAVSAADLPSKGNPIAPSKPTTSESTSIYGGFSVGSLASTSLSPWYGGAYTNARLGWELNEYVRLEGDYDFAWNETSNRRAHIVTGNVIGQYKIGFIPVVPYALAGAGYRWSGIKNEPVYVAGAGVRYDIDSNFEIDARYRYITDADRKRDANVMTLGVNYKF